MKPLLWAVVVLGFFTRAQPAPPARVPVLVELFTSEGCSSCPGADAHLAVLLREQPVAGALIVPIALHVDYFDHAGWKDPFSSPAFSNRQQDYSRLFGTGSVYTPQVVVNGREAVVGIEHALVDRAIAAAARRTPLPLTLVVDRIDDRARVRVTVPASPPGGEPIALMAAITQDGLSTDVARGENSGRRLHHVAVARSLEQVAMLGREPRTVEHSFRIDRGWGGSGLKANVWLQGRRSRQVYGAAAEAVSN